MNIEIYIPDFFLDPYIFYPIVGVLYYLVALVGALIQRVTDPNDDKEDVFALGIAFLIWPISYTFLLVYALGRIASKNPK